MKTTNKTYIFNLIRLLVIILLLTFNYFELSAQRGKGPSNCARGFGPASYTANANSGSTTVAVLLNDDNCNIQGNTYTPYSWLHINFNTPTHFVFTLSWDANTSTSSRTGYVYCEGQRFTITQKGKLITPPSPTVTYSNGNAILRRATPPSGVIYYWQGTSCGSSKSNSSLTYTVSSAGTYKLRAFGNGAWSSCRSKTVSYQGGSVSGSKTICEGSSTGTLTLSGYFGNIIKWQYSKDGGSWIDISHTSKIYSTTPSSYGSYRYRSAIGSSGSPSYSTYTTITVKEKPRVTSHPDNTTVCEGNPYSFTVTATGDNITYKWYFMRPDETTSASGLPGYNTATVTKNSSQLSLNGYQYRCKVDNEWCSETYSNYGTVTVNTVPSVSVSPQNSDIIQGESVTLTATGASAYAWSPSNGLSSTTGAQIIATPTTSTTYTVTGTTNGCSTDALATINVFEVNITENGNSLTANVNGGTTPYRYLWNTGATNATINNCPDGYYTVFITEANNNKVQQTFLLETATPYTNVNYVRSQRLLIEETDENAVNSKNENGKSEIWQYFDGLGRAIQTVSTKASPNKMDMVQAIVYDEFGREKKAYLPYPGEIGNGAYRPHAVSEQSSYYFTSHNQELFPFSETEFDSSPLNRIMKQGAPGTDWQLNQHSVAFAYKTNTANQVVLWEVNSAGACMPATNIYYNQGELYVSEITDENGHITIEYKNKTGNVLLKEAINGIDTLQTYYVYDDYGLLRYVLPPLAIQMMQDAGNWNFSTEIDELIYYYEYDGRKRMTMKKIPGVAPIYMVYDKRDRLALTQDGNMRINNQWNFIKYDALDRPVMTGIYNHASLISQNSMQDTLDTQTVLFDKIQHGREHFHGYTNLSFPLNITEQDVYSITYYDNYDFDTLVYDYIPYTEFDAENFNNVKGQLTAIKVKVLGTNTYLTTLNFYDEKYRVIQIQSENMLGGEDIVTNKYDFVGKVLKTKHDHTSNIDTIVTWKNFAYDHAGRLFKVKQEIEGDANGEVVMAKMVYNELGELETKYLHKYATKKFLQDIDYTYNIRGWLTSINDPENMGTDLFGMKLSYNENVADLTKQQQYNGNISAMIWNAANYAQVQGYGFDYDAINRLTEADYAEKSTAWNDLNKYTVDNLTYDQNGNIESLNREGQANQIDALVYGYSGNQLAKVTDNAVGTDTLGFKDGSDLLTEYLYDANGNMVRDFNKGIDTVLYNNLNLPAAIYFGDIANENYLEYIYDAAGTKLIKYKIENGIVTDSTHYIGSMIYNQDSLSFILTAEGRCTPNGNGNYQYEYFLKDHLGNTRVSFTDSDNDNIADITQEDHYYPFGMTMNGLSYVNGVNKNKYLYNGKEMQDDQIAGVKLDWYDYGARMYDASLGRWNVIDNKTEKYYPLSPYTYAANNPLLFTDPDGNEIIIGSNTARTITLLSQLAATNKGEIRINRLISSNAKYYTQTVFISSSSAYDDDGQRGKPLTIYHPSSVWLPYVQKGVRTSLNITGHEIDHAYHHDLEHDMSDKESLESSAVHFGNYIRSVYSEGAMRKGYAGPGYYLSFSGNEEDYNRNNEEISDFTQTDELSYTGATILGFSYSHNGNGNKEKVYMLSSKTKSGKFIYAKYTSKEEYDKVINEINKKEKKEKDDD